MKLIQTIECGDDFFEVEFTAFPTWINPSYSDEFGLVKLDEYPDIENLPTWEQSQFTFSENFIIAIWLTQNIEKVTEKFCNLLREETIPDY